MPAPAATRRCEDCGQDKPAKNFYVYTRKGVSYYRKICQVCYYQHRRDKELAYYRQHRTTIRAKQTAAARSKAAFVREYKASHPCTDCGQSFPSYCMDFDHVPGRGEKVRAIGPMAGKSPRDAVLREMAKCDLVGANCHRIRTHHRTEERLMSELSDFDRAVKICI